MMAISLDVRWKVWSPPCSINDNAWSGLALDRMKVTAVGIAIPGQQTAVRIDDCHCPKMSGFNDGSSGQFKNGLIFTCHG